MIGPRRDAFKDTGMTANLATDRVLQALSRQCHCDLGQRRALVLAPLADQSLAEAALAEVAEADVLLSLAAVPAVPQRVDVRPLLEQAVVGAALTALELWQIGTVARSANAIRRMSQHWPPTAGRLARAAGQLADLRLLAELVEESVDGEGRILDSASPELARLRNEISVISARLRRRIEQLVRDTDDAGLLQDDYFTLRDDRYVLPVRHSAKRTLAGIIHGTSQTGQTVYVEPQEMVDGNNQLALAFDALRREEARILAELTALCAQAAPELEQAADGLAALDLRMAAARLARQLQAHRPHFHSERIDLPQLRHPLLVIDGAAAVPNHVCLRGNPARWLVVSGPNGGGKTVALTSLGLAAEMARRGLFVTAGADATLPWFESVHAVIGDAQDLHLGLSTFEGHLRAIAAVLDSCGRNPQALVLIDELAAGTEPLAGAALATAVLEHLATAVPTSWGAVTTHFEACKLLALRNPAFVNAALGRDGRTGAPTYRLALGEVGTSDPLGLARRVGLPAGLLERTAQLLGTGGAELETMLATLQAERDAMAAERARLEHERAQLDHSRKLLDSQRHAEKIMADRRVSAKAEAQLEELARIGQQIEALRSSLADADRRQLEAANRAVRDQQRAVTGIAQAAQEARGPEARRKPMNTEDIRAGAQAFHGGLGKNVQVVEVDAKGRRAKVAAGGLELWAGFEVLLATAGPIQPAKRSPAAPQAMQRNELAQPTSLDEAAFALRTAEATVDLRGLRVDEALEAVDKHLDRMILRGLPGACVIHGVGTGALQAAVRAHLGRHPLVGQWRPGDKGEGGEGVAMVWLRGD